jgi:hypothetical protein
MHIIKDWDYQRSYADVLAGNIFAIRVKIQR